MIKRITAGECLKEILEKRYNEEFIPFNEAMIQGTYSSKLFSEAFIVERANTHSVSVEEYKQKLSGFLDLLSALDKYDEIHLYFGDEPFCNENRNVVIEALHIYGFRGQIISHIVDEYTGDILSTRII